MPARPTLLSLEMADNPELIARFEQLIADSLGESLTSDNDISVFIKLMAYLQAQTYTKLKEFPDIRDIDLAPEDFLQYYKQEFALKLPDSTNFDLREFIRESKNWYSGKGTTELLSFIGALTNTDIDLFESSRLIMRFNSPKTLISVATSTHHPSSLDSLTSATFFQIPVMSLLIHNWKYRALKDLTPPLSKLLTETLERTSIPLPDIITAVPLHPKRLRERDFNQSDLLAEKVASHINFLIPITEYLPLLDKVRHTKPQSKQQNREARLANLTDAFALNKEYKDVLKGKTVWIIDDVTTTGTTLTECARVLKTHGAKEVHGFVVAH
jgi:ComF family protein